MRVVDKIVKKHAMKFILSLKVLESVREKEMRRRICKHWLGLRKGDIEGLEIVSPGIK